MDAYETSIYTAVVITSMLLGCIFLALTRSLIRSQRRFYLKKGEAYQADIRLLEDRNRIARDLHDELGPELSLALMKLRRVQGGAKQPALEEVEKHIETISARLKRIAVNLLPAALLNKSLLTAIRDFLDECSLAYPQEFLCTADAEKSLPMELKMHLFRIVQEAVHNSIKHAEAKVITVKLKLKEDLICLVCSDDGKGIAPGRRKGMGLTNIHDRALLLGGRISCYSSASKGTTFYVEIPLKK